MDCLEAIRKERTKGRLYCGSADQVDSVQALAAAMGLATDPACYREIDEEQARAILVGVLHRDLAFGARIMSLTRAEALAASFMERFGEQRRFFTNGTFREGAGVGLVLVDWKPATGATFDTGILALGAPESACVWVSEEG